MIVVYHPQFAEDINRFTAQYAAVSARLGERFQSDIETALSAVIANPSGAGHFVDTGSHILREVRRRNLTVFPFFILYALVDERLIFGSVIPSASDPLNWLPRVK
jgi:hypothetical protein